MNRGSIAQDRTMESYNHNYSSINEAIKGLLIKTCAILDDAGTEWVIAGGWVPFLRIDHTQFKHPGTKDVDILFSDNPQSIENAVKQLLKAGYIPSAKHPFQLLKKLNVDNHQFVFNIDLMHPIEGQANPELFNDIIDLGVKEDYDPEKTVHVKSICFPSSLIVFEEKLWSSFPVKGILPDGQEKEIKIPLLNEPALILSKCESVSASKRQRDSFDIYFVLSGPNGQTTANTLKKMSKNFPQVCEQLKKLENFLTTKNDHFSSNVYQYAYPDTYPIDRTNFADVVYKMLFA